MLVKASVLLCVETWNSSENALMYSIKTKKRCPEMIDAVHILKRLVAPSLDFANIMATHYNETPAEGHRNF